MATLRAAYDMQLTERQAEIDRLKQINAELLAALELLVKHAVERGSLTIEPGNGPMHVITAAIAKARGERYMEGRGEDAQA